MNNQGVINMGAIRKAMRIEGIISRLDARGERLMTKAIAERGGPRYADYVVGIMVLSNRCLKLATYINGLSRPQRRSA